MKNISLDITRLSQSYRKRELTPDVVIADILQNIQSNKENPIWIYVLSEEELAPYLKNLTTQSPEDLPLYGIPFAIKDNIDLANVPTTAACPAYSYIPTKSATVVQHLINAGAIPIGKTNLDQFATGLVGTRSPHGTCHNSFDANYISGGSSSGSSVAVATGLVSFSLGTDTAGSGRVPASLNNIVGLKPSPGLISTQGVVPACRSLDCVSIFGLCTQDTEKIFSIAAKEDATDPYSRKAHWAEEKPNTAFQFGVLLPKDRQFFGNSEAAELYEASIQRMTRLGGKAVMFDYAPFSEVAQLLYEGPWVAERYAAVGEFIKNNPEAIFPVTREIISGGADYQAADAFAAFYKLRALKQQIHSVFKSLDFLMLPTNGTIYTIQEVKDNPIQLNSNLGYYTNFMNLLEFSGLALPSGFFSNGLPFGITLVGQTFDDLYLLKMGGQYQQASSLTMGTTDWTLPSNSNRKGTQPVETITTQEQTSLIAVCGAHMSGLPLNHQLTTLGGQFVEITETAPQYHLYALTDQEPIRPGLIRAKNGLSIQLELWSLPISKMGYFLSQIQAPLALGKLLLKDGREVIGFLCEPYACKNAQDITALQSWRTFLKQ